LKSAALWSDQRIDQRYRLLCSYRVRRPVQIVGVMVA
jgi:ferredoxin